MRIRFCNSQRGIAIIIVMMVILVLGILAGGFAYSMKVETKLARNAGHESELEWLGRSGVELARYVLGISMTVPNEGNYDALNQKWAGGPMGTNEILASISLENVELGRGKFTVKIVDLERKMNINVADDAILRQALTLMSVNAVEMSPISDAIRDWIDPDDNTLLNGAESDYYLGIKPAYEAKNGPIDDLSELLLIRGISPEMYWGPAATNRFVPVHTGPLSRMHADDFPTYSVGFVDLFTPISQRSLNPNTASAQALQLIPGLDETTAQAIITARAGPDGVDGTEDDTPFRNAGELPMRVPGFSGVAPGSLGGIFNTRSVTFQVTVTAQIDDHKADWVAILVRANPRDIKVVSMYKK